MKIARIVLAAGVLVVFAPAILAQGRLNDLSARLATEAADLADSSYRAYTASFRNGRGEIEGVMAAQQFSGAAEVFRRMVSDRRREPELRDAFSFVQNLSQSLDRYNFDRTHWSRVQRLIGDISN